MWIGSNSCPSFNESIIIVFDYDLFIETSNKTVKFICITDYFQVVLPVVIKMLLGLHLIRQRFAVGRQYTALAIQHKTSAFLIDCSNCVSVKLALAPLPQAHSSRFK